MTQARQEKALRAGVDIVVACPGRLEDLMKQKVISLESVEITVLDEADHMADLGFLPVVKRLLDTTPHAAASVCCSRPRWTTAWTRSSSATSPTR